MREDRTLAKDSDLNYFCNATNQAVSQIFFSINPYSVSQYKVLRGACHYSIY